MRLALLAGMAALCTFTATTVSAALNYNPVVLVVSGTNPSLTRPAATTSISIYQQGVSGQTAPISMTAYNSSTTGIRLVNDGLITTEGLLANNPGVANAAAQGLTYGGSQYVYNGGYDAAFGIANVSDTSPPDGVTQPNAPRAFGQTNVTNSVASAATVLQTQTAATLPTSSYTYVDAAIRGAVGDDTGANKYTSGTTNSNSPYDISGGFRDFTPTPSTRLTSGHGTYNSSDPTGPKQAMHNTHSIELLVGEGVAGAPNGRLFGTRGQVGGAPNVGLYTFLPTGTSSDPVPTPMINTGNNSNPFEFALFNDPNYTPASGSALNFGYDTAYITNINTVNGGIDKWVWNGSSWGSTPVYTLRDSALAVGTALYRGLAGQLDAATGRITLYTTVLDQTDTTVTSTTFGTSLQQKEDTGVADATANFTTLAFQSSILAGDYNANGTVDAADYVVWRKNENTTIILPNDVLGGGVATLIGADQYSQWRANFGKTQTAFRGVALSAVAAGSGSGAVGAVPEPASAWLLLIGLAILRSGRRRFVR